jgi:hypothetical protein
MKNGICNV